MIRVYKELVQIEMDSKKEGNVIGRKMYGEHKGKVVFFQGNKPFPGEGHVVLEEYEDKGKFLVCRQWRGLQCTIYRFPFGTDFSKYHTDSYELGYKGLRGRLRTDKELASDERLIGSYMRNGIVEAQKELLRCMADDSHTYVFHFEVREMAGRFLPYNDEGITGPANLELFVENRRVFDRVIVSGNASWGESPYDLKSEGMAVIFTIGDDGHIKSPDISKKLLVDATETDIRYFIVDNWHWFTVLPDNQGLVYRYNDTQWIWVRDKNAGGRYGNWRMAYLIHAPGCRDVKSLLEQKRLSTNRDKHVLSCLPWVP